MSVRFNDNGVDAKGLREIEFFASADTEIEIFAWDWNYEEGKPFKAEVLIDKSGHQIHKFAPGQHTIAVQAVDNEGLEAVEIVRLKVNGKVEIEDGE